jgi:hypothetical protein
MVLSCNKDHRLGRTRRTIKEEEEKEGENYCTKKTHGTYLGTERSSMGLFFISVRVKFLLENKS